MLLIILTLTLCLTKALVYENSEETSLLPNTTVEPIYNINEWVTKLQLERCALVAVGLKYFAIFVEDEILGENGRVEHSKYFLGICPQDTLEEWTFCSPNLSKRRQHKCSFKLRTNKYQDRVHRRFCDIRIMVNNKDCPCEPTILGDEMVKVKGFPTCYIPPLSKSLCNYNVCGLFQCRATMAEDRVHSVKCNPNCKGGNPFCEYPIDRTSRVPEVRSFWSKWRESQDRESPKMTGRKHSVATCINKYTGKGDVDCLGPGTGCCPTSNKNCNCNTFEENGTLKVERIIYEDQTGVHSTTNPSKEHLHPFEGITRKKRTLHRHIRADDNDDIEDDEDDDNDLDEDIVLEENTDEEVTITTTEELEKDEAIQELHNDVLKELNQVKNATAGEQKNNVESIFPYDDFQKTLFTVTTLSFLTSNILIYS